MALSAANMSALTSLSVAGSTAAAVSSTLLGVTPATTLPSSPADKQQAILVDSTSAPTYAWLLQYSSTASKWNFIGGSGALVEVTTAETINNAGYVALATAGPSFTAVRAGDYFVEIGAEIEESTFPNATVTTGYMSYDIGATGAVDADAARAVVTGTSGTTNNIYGGSVSRIRRKTLAASTALVAKYTNKNTGNFVQFRDRWMRVTPITLT